VRTARIRSVLLSWIALGGLLLAPVLTQAGEPSLCHRPRLADVGWSDVTATTATLSALLTELGYEPQVSLLSVPVTFEALKRGDIDVFLGNWMPAQTANVTPYLRDHAFDVVATNLQGAKYTLAVPEYTWREGLRDFKDIAPRAQALHHQLFGIEPGNDGNRHILELIQHNEFNLGHFQLVESSEQGMLAAVERAERDHQPIVFLAWAPHPMNRHWAIHYLTGGDRSFGPDFGSASVRTLMRSEVKQRCPTILKLTQQLVFTVDDENELMDLIASSTEPPLATAQRWLKAHPEQHHRWLQGLEPAARSGVLSGLTALPASAINVPKLPVGPAIADALGFLKQRGVNFFKAIGVVIQTPVDAVNRLLRLIPIPVHVLLLAALAWGVKRSWGLAVYSVIGLGIIINLGYWSLTLDTLSLVLVAALFCMLLGVPLGVLSAHHRVVAATLNPLLDLMQTLPSFVYLIPTLVLFGLGTVPAVLATIVFAIPFPIRLTQLGLSQIEPSLLEAADAFGATPLQKLWWVELPAARESILQGLTQCVMACLSMVVIAALVGASGLGVPVVRALNTVSIGEGFEAGLAIVLLAIGLDRWLRPRGRG